MTANQDLLQRLIVQINAVLAQAPSLLPWRTSAQAAHQRQLLEAVQAYLHAQIENQSEPFNSDVNNAQAAMQAVVQEMNALRSTLLSPLHAEVATLMQQRNALVCEIRQLEAYRQLLERSQTPTPAERETPQAKQIDTALNAMFQSLQKEIEAYQDSLSQGISRLHHLGCQSEALFSRLVERLNDYSGRDAAFVQSDILPPALAAMPYAGTEFAVMSTTTRSNSGLSFDSIRQLTELVDQLAVEAEPITVAAIPPQEKNQTTQKSSNGLEALSELQILFQSSESTQTASVETTRDQLDQVVDQNRGVADTEYE